MKNAMLVYTTLSPVPTELEDKRKDEWVGEDQLREIDDSEAAACRSIEQLIESSKRSSDASVRSLVSFSTDLKDA